MLIFYQKISIKIEKLKLNNIIMANIQEKIDALCYILFVLLIVVMFGTINDPDQIRKYPDEGERIWILIFGLIICYIGLRMIAKFLKSICTLFG